MKAINEDNKEGFVIKFSNGFRIKIKFEDYCRLHRILTGVSNVAIWDYLYNNLPFDNLLDKVPDEFYNWLKKTENDLRVKYNEIYDQAKSVFKEFDTRKETALYIQQQKYPQVMFQMLDGKSPEKLIWKMVKPAYSKPFKNDD